MLFKKKQTIDIEDINNVVQSIGFSKSLYKKLIVLSHPDNNPNDIEKATEISTLVIQNKFNLRELKKIEILINEQLKNKLH